MKFSLRLNQRFSTTLNNLHYGFYSIKDIIAILVFLNLGAVNYDALKMLPTKINITKNLSHVKSRVCKTTETTYNRLHH